MSTNTYGNIFSSCRRILGIDTWGRVLAALDEGDLPEGFPDRLQALTSDLHLPAFIADLAGLERVRHQTPRDVATSQEKTARSIRINPTLSLLALSWKHLTNLVKAEPGFGVEVAPEPGETYALVWRHEETGAVECREAGDIDLLALKIVAEEIDLREAATEGGVTVGEIQYALDQALAQGLLMSPGSLIRRPLISSGQEERKETPYRTAEVFTLQWHITNDCDLNCKHCYDRSRRPPMEPAAAMAILDDFYLFCREMNVRGQVTFTGGNPLLYPHFMNLYQAAHDMGFTTAILGNPTPSEQIEKIKSIAKPALFQISLEGLEVHNDFIRGDGHFQRSLAFLEALRRLKIYSMVMLTLTRDNLDQVLPLGEVLRERADHFTFNRLSAVGRGAQLLMPAREDFEAFLRLYEVAASENPVLGLKDNLINIIRNEKALAPFGGCTGFGCGAAFNFVSLLPDGEVHACRKFPSLIGNMLQTPLMDIYHSDPAERYRTGSRACRDCALNSVCRGCLAVTHSLGLDIFEDKDPFCFYS